MGIQPGDLDNIKKLHISKLRNWINGQKPESPFHQAAKYEIERREKRNQWIKWGIGIGVAVLGLIIAVLR